MVFKFMLKERGDTIRATTKEEKLGSINRQCKTIEKRRGLALSFHRGCGFSFQFLEHCNNLGFLGGCGLRQDPQGLVISWLPQGCGLRQSIWSLVTTWVLGGCELGCNLWIHVTYWVPQRLWVTIFGSKSSDKFGRG